MSIQSMIMSNDTQNVQILLQMLYKDDKNRSEKKLPLLINKWDEETGDTPLISALKVGNWDIVSLLMKYGADPMAENQNGEIPARIKSPIRSLFISEYLNRSAFDKRKDETQSLLAVASDVILSSLKYSFTSINNMLESCQFNPQCINCKLAKAIYFHTECHRLVLCQSCFDKFSKKQNDNQKNSGPELNNFNDDQLMDSNQTKQVKCPFCQKDGKVSDFIQTKYIKLDYNLEQK